MNLSYNALSKDMQISLLIFMFPAICWNKFFIENINFHKKGPTLVIITNQDKLFSMIKS